MAVVSRHVGSTIYQRESVMVRALTATSTDTQLGFIWTLVEVPRVRDLYWQFVSHFELIEFSLGILAFEIFFIIVFFVFI